MRLSSTFSACAMQVLLHLALGQLVDMGQQVVERAVLLQELGRRLRPDAGHAGHVVHAVADQGLEIDDLLRA